MTALRFARRVPYSPHYTCSQEWYVVTVPVLLGLPWWARLLEMPVVPLRGRLRVDQPGGCFHGVMLHEAMHALEQRRLGMLRWLLAYAWGLLRHGIADHPMEQAAALAVLQMYRGTHPSLSLDTTLAEPLTTLTLLPPLPGSVL